MFPHKLPKAAACAACLRLSGKCCLCRGHRFITAALHGIREIPSTVVNCCEGEYQVLKRGVRDLWAALFTTETAVTYTSDGSAALRTGGSRRSWIRRARYRNG